ncbi:hypothetical protein [Paracoccus sp. T5]|uniref:hypothetical protein n=1 Tax=Paracoccus sp. T5 TaxID=3402161 RepID=UPI003AE3735F
MLTSSFKTLLIGGKVAATAALLATTAMAQTTAIDTPQGNTVVVPDQALETQPSGGFVLESDYPRLDSMENNEMIAETLIAQGYSDVVISREGPILTVTAQRAAVPIELVYSTANGRLISVDGVETRPAAGGTSAGDTATGTTADTATPAAAAEDAATDGITDDSETDAATDGTGTEAGTGGSDVGTDADADTGADTGPDGADTSGADTDGAGTDGADTDGADSDSDSSGADGADADSGTNG